MIARKPPLRSRLHLLPVLLLLLVAAASHLAQAANVEAAEQAAEAESPVEENLLESADQPEEDYLDAMELLKDKAEVDNLTPEEVEELQEVQQKWRIRFRVPRFRFPRFRFPRIRLPRIRLPRIRLPRIHLPRIRLPRIRLPRIRLRRIRFRKLNVFRHIRRGLDKLKHLLRRPNIDIEKILKPAVSEAYQAVMEMLDGMETQARDIKETQQHVRQLAKGLRLLRRAARPRRRRWYYYY